MYGVDATIFILKKTPDSLGDSLGPTLTGGIAPKNNLSSIGLRKV